MATIHSTDTLSISEYCRLDRSEVSPITKQSKKKNQLQFVGEIALDLPENIKSMEAEECFIVIRFVLDIPTIKVTNIKFEPEGGLAKLMERKDKYFKPEEDVLGIPIYNEDLNILEYIAEVQNVINEFIRKIVEKHVARKSL